MVLVNVQNVQKSAKMCKNVQKSANVRYLVQFLSARFTILYANLYSGAILSSY